MLYKKVYKLYSRLNFKQITIHPATVYGKSKTIKAF